MSSSLHPVDNRIWKTASDDSLHLIFREDSIIELARSRDSRFLEVLARLICGDVDSWIVAVRAMNYLDVPALENMFLDIARESRPTRCRELLVRLTPVFFHGDSVGCKRFLGRVASKLSDFDDCIDAPLQTQEDDHTTPIELSKLSF